MNDQTGMNTNKPILLGLKAKKNQKLECWDHIKLFEITPFLYKCQIRNRVQSRTISYLLLSAVPLFQRPVISVTHTRGGRGGSAAAAAAAAARAVLLRVARHPVRGVHDDDGMSGVCAVQPLR